MDREIALGFGNVKSDKETEMENLFTNFQSSGIIKLGEDEDPDEIEE